ncbi:NAD(P)-dependent oxidoreductase [Novosphingobium sp.]|uniref:NAD-dependent epimerase/dehydratase family protein n=1 Tax=Novosphingobium sp. TaxID=1874826 RepID=UPI0031DA5F7E
MPHTIFLAGAAGVIGQRLVPLLLQQGHTVFGTTRSAERAAHLEAAGARPVIVDVFDAEALARAVADAAPTVVIHQLTDLSGDMATDPEAARRANARLRREGTPNLVRASVATGARRIIAQSIAWAYAPGTPPYAEEDPLEVDADGARGTTIREGIVPLERAVLETPGIEGVVLRYGQLFGPGTWSEAPDGASPLHVDAAAYAAVLAIDHGAPGIYNVANPGGEVRIDKAISALGWNPDFRMAAQQVAPTA